MASKTESPDASTRRDGSPIPDDKADGTLYAAVVEKWVPPVIAGLMAGFVAVATTLWLEPSQKRSLAVFDDKRRVASELQSAFSKYLISMDVYRQHMAKEDTIDLNDEQAVAAFREQADSFFGEFNRKTMDLTYVLADADMYFNDANRSEIAAFRAWHNSADKTMQTWRVSEWPPLSEFSEWRSRIVLEMKREILGDQ